MPEAVTTNSYSIAHEALINICKHSGKCDAIVRLQLGKEHSCLKIEDHGYGFDPNADLDQRGHLGLIGMSERAREIGWQLSVSSRPGQGTRIRVISNLPGGSGGTTQRDHSAALLGFSYGFLLSSWYPTPSHILASNCDGLDILICHSAWRHIDLQSRSVRRVSPLLLNLASGTFLISDDFLYLRMQANQVESQRNNYGG